MTDEIRTLVGYRLDRAREAIEEAEALLGMGHANTAVNRLYYAAFYAASAALLSRGLSSSKHSGVRSMFHQNFVRHGAVPRNLGRFFDTLFDSRQRGDYGDLVRFDPADVAPWVEETRRFVGLIEQLLRGPGTEK